MVMSRSRSPGGWLLVILVLMMLCLALSTGCVAPPRENGSEGGNSGGDKTQTTQPTATTRAIIDTQFLTPATPYPTPTTPPGTPFVVVTEAPVQLTQYQSIYYNVLDFTHQTVAYSYDLSDPPMIIEICIEPEMVTRKVWYQSRYKDKEKEYTETKSYISQAAWFEVVVRDKNSGEVVEKEGFAKTYSVDTKKEITIRRTGDYLIEFTGNDVSAVIQIRIPLREGETGEISESLVCSGLFK